MQVKIKALPFIQDETQRVSIREYLRHYKSYNDNVNSTGQKIIITNQSEDIVAIVPIKQKRVWTMEDFKDIGFTGGGPTLSQDIDKIVYGI